MKLSTITVTFALLALLGGCSTVKGAGQDIEGLGEKIQEVSDDTKKEIQD